MGLLKAPDADRYTNFQSFAESAPEREYPILPDITYIEKGDITLADVQELATAKATDDMFVSYLQQYIDRLSTVLEQIETMKQAEKPLKQRLRDSQKLLDKLTKSEPVVVPDASVWDVTSWDVTSEAIVDLSEFELPVTTLPSLIDSSISDDFKHIL
jgi:hypothetical protein